MALRFALFLQIFHTFTKTQFTFGDLPQFISRLSAWDTETKHATIKSENKVSLYTKLPILLFHNVREIAHRVTKVSATDS